MQVMRDRLHAAIASGLTEMRLNGHPEMRLPNTLSLSFRDLEANRILEAIGLEVAASAGAACHADSVEISHVLKAMAVPEQWAKGTLRLTTGRMTTATEIDRAADVIIKAVIEMR
jgi:cysteine desulfurase